MKNIPSKRLLAWSVFLGLCLSLCFPAAPMLIGNPGPLEYSAAPKGPSRVPPVIKPMTLEEIREMIEREGYNYSVGETWVSTLSPEEMAALLGYVPPPMDLSRLRLFSPGTGEPTFSPTFDWRDYGVVTFPKDQGPCGSCWCFAGVGQMESQILVNLGPEYDLSEENVLSCNFIGQGCSGGNDITVVNFLTKYGAFLEACAPYDATDGTPCTMTCTPVNKLRGWRIIGAGLASEDPALIDLVKDALLNYGPLWVTMDASGPGFGSYTGGVYEWWDPIGPNHAILLIGWDDTLSHSHGSGAWIAKNSWGTGWGDGGYFEIAYGSALFCDYVSGYSRTDEFDDQEVLYYHDEAGWTTQITHNAAPGDTWGAVRFVPATDGILETVELWAVDDTLNYEIYVYDSRSGTGPSSYTFTGLLSYQSGSLIGVNAKAGYHTVELSTKPAITAGNDFIVAVRFNTPYYEYSVPVDNYGPDSGESYGSPDGTTWDNFTELGIPWDVGIRAEVQNGSCLPPLDLQITGFGNGFVGLTWDKIFGILGFNIYRAENSGGPYTKVNSSLITTNTYTDTGVTNGITYYYVVTAVYTGCESIYSNEVSGTPIYCDILLVYDDAFDQGFNTYYEDALTANGYSYYCWNVLLEGSPDLSVLNAYSVVIWALPASYAPSDSDQATLMSYLDDGGNLFITGQDIGWSIYEYQGHSSSIFYENYLHATYVQDSVDLWNLTGTPGDPISDGVTLTISGGDGADNQSWPSEIDPIGPAVTIFTYSGASSSRPTQPASIPEKPHTLPLAPISSGSGAIRVDTATYKVVYFAFGFEGINNPTDRNTVMGNVINWLKPPVTLGLYPGLFSTNSFFVVGDNAYCTDVLGTAKIAFGLGLGGVPENPEGRTDTLLTLAEHDAGNLMPVGGPAINPTAVEFDGYFGITYDYVENDFFQINAEGYSIYLDLDNYPQSDICVVYLAEHNGRNIMLVWGYGWRGTYAGSMLMGDPALWQTYEDAHLLMLRWIDSNADGLVQMSEIVVEVYQ